MNKNTCKWCLYYDKSSCHRYPESVIINQETEHWCGEFIDYENPPTPNKKGFEKNSKSDTDDLLSMSF